MEEEDKMEFEFAKKVLLVDDDPDFLMEAKVGLEEKGERVDVITSSSANKGLNLLGEKDFDAVVSCSRVQDIGYIDFLNKIRNEIEVDIPFILFTDKKSNEIVFEALKAGVSRVINKEDENINLSCKILNEILNQEIQDHKNKKELKNLRIEFNKNFGLYR